MWYGAVATPIELFGPTRYQGDAGTANIRVLGAIQRKLITMVTLILN